MASKYSLALAFSLSVLLAFSSLEAFSQIFTSIASGNWTSGAVWSCAGDCSGRIFPGEGVFVGDTVLIHHSITLNTGISPEVSTLSIDNSVGPGILTVSSPANLVVGLGGVSLTGVTSGSDDAQIIANGPNTVTISGMVVTRNQGAASSVSSVSLQLSNATVFTVMGNLWFNYNDNATTNEITNEIWVGNGGAGDNSQLNITGNLVMSMNSQSQDNLSIRLDQDASLAIDGNLLMTLVDGSTGTSIVRVDARDNSSITVGGSTQLSFNDATSPNSNENVEILLGSNGGSPSMTTNNLAMISTASAGSVYNNFIKLENNAVLTINGGISFANSGSSSENRVELNTASRVDLFGNISSPTKGTFDFNGSSTIQFLGSIAQTIPRVRINSTFKNMVVNNSSGTPLTLVETPTLAGNLTLTNGKIASTASFPFTFADGATTDAGNSTSYITGPVGKNCGTINNDIILPIGSAAEWAPLGISSLSGASSSNVFTAQYFRSPYSDIANKGPGIGAVSGVEHWGVSVTGTPPSSDITLFWKDACFSGITDLSTFDLSVGSYFGGQWNLLGSSVDITSQACLSGGETGNVTTSPTINTYTAFTFVSQAANALPVTLSGFWAESDNEGNVKLNWETASEINSSHFVISKSTDAIFFESIGEVDSHGNSTEPRNYSLIDSSPTTGINYYRLAEVDLWGHEEIYKTIAFEAGPMKSSFSIFPNPVQRGELITIKALSFDKETLHIEKVTSIIGMDVSGLCTIDGVDYDEIRIQTSGLTPGSYLIYFGDNTSKAAARFMIR